MLIICVLVVWVAHADTGNPAVGVTVGKDTVTVNLSLVLRENLTSLPYLNVFLDQSNSANVTKPMEAAIQKLIPGSQIQLVNGRLQMVPLNITNTWKISENYTLSVKGVNANRGNTIESNLAFLSMNVSDPIRIGTVEINNVGAEYFLQPLIGLYTSQTKYFLNGAIFLKPPIPGNFTARFSLLDFAWVPPISQWNHQMDVFASSSTWNASPDPPYNMTVGTVVRENTILKGYTAVYAPAVQLTAPARAWATGTTIMFYQQTISDLLMPTIIGVSLVSLLGTFLLDRRLTVGWMARRKKR